MFLLSNFIYEVIGAVGHGGSVSTTPFFQFKGLNPILPFKWIEFYVLHSIDQSKQRTHLGYVGGKHGDVHGYSPQGYNGGYNTQVSVYGAQAAYKTRFLVENKVHSKVHF